MGRAVCGCKLHYFLEVASESFHCLIIFIHFRSHVYAKHKMWTVATHVCLSVGDDRVYTAPEAQLLQVSIETARMSHKVELHLISPATGK